MKTFIKSVVNMIIFLLGGKGEICEKDEAEGLLYFGGQE